MPYATFRKQVVFLNVFLGLLAAGASRIEAQSAPSPMFSTLTPTAGEMSSSFVVFLPLANGGTGAATHVTVNSVTLGGVAETSPVLPVNVGSIAAGGFSELHLQFDRSKLTLGRNFLLTIRGTYDTPSSAAKLAFTVNRFVNVAAPTAAQQNDLMKWLVMDDIRDKMQSLSGVDEATKAQTLLAYLESRPEIAASGMDPDFSSLWGQFADGDGFIICVDRHVDTPVPPASNTMVTPAARPAVETAAVRQAALVKALAATPGVPTELPKVAGVRLLNGLDGPGWGDSGVIADLSAWVLPAGYFLSGSPEASVNLLKGVGGDGVLYFASHGGFGNDQEYAVWTTTESSEYADVNTYRLDLYGNDANPRTLRRMLADTEFDQNTQQWKDEWHYGINAKFVTKYWQPFGGNSFVYIDACKSGTGRANDFQQAVVGKQATVYAGWTVSVADKYSGSTTRLLFDRMLGADKYCPETGATCAPGKASAPVFAQRPFDYTSVTGTEFAAHSLGSGFTTLSAGGPTFGLMAPSISNMQVDETMGDGGQLTLMGIFGSNQDTVEVGGFEAHVETWSANRIVVDLNLSGAGAAGDVQVTVRGHKSNVARLTEWSSDQYTYTITGDGSLKMAATFNLHFRMDMRKYRPTIHNVPVEPSGVTVGAADSFGNFTASGSGSGPDIIYKWSGGASLTGFTLNIPITGENIVTATMQIVDSKKVNVFVGAAPEANAPEATCTTISGNPPVTDTSRLELVGPGNLVVLIGDKGPRTFPFTLDDHAVITAGSFGAQGQGLFSAYAECMDESKTAAYNFKWGPISPTSGTAPDPDSAR
jgi:hypothetical protein